jgi:hypothetical protein
VNDPLGGYERQLAPEALSGLMEELPLDLEQDDLPAAYLGLYHQLAVRALEALGAEAGTERLHELTLRIGSLEGALRFEAWELGAETEALGRAGRISALESRVKRGWLVPRLRDEIALYRRRIDALEQALERA